MRRLEVLLGWHEADEPNSEVADGTLQQLTRCCANLLVRPFRPRPRPLHLHVLRRHRHRRLRLRLLLQVRADCREDLVACGGLKAIIGAASASDGDEDVLAAVARALANLTFDLEMAAQARPRPTSPDLARPRPTSPDLVRPRPSSSNLI